MTIDVCFLHLFNIFTGNTKAGYLGGAGLRRLQQRLVHMLNAHVVLAQAGGTATPYVETRRHTMCQSNDPLGPSHVVGVTYSSIFWRDASFRSVAKLLARKGELACLYGASKLTRIIIPAVRVRVRVGKETPRSDGQNGSAQGYEVRGDTVRCKSARPGSDIRSDTAYHVTS